MDGVGGHSQLGFYTASHINCFLAGPKDPVAINFLGAVFDFILGTDAPHKTLRSAVVSPHQVVAALTRALCALATIPGSDALQATNTCVQLISKTFITTPANKNITQAIEAGFIRAILSYITREEWQGRSLPHISYLFTRCLTQSTVHYTTLLALARAMKDASTLAATEKFIRSSVYTEYRGLVGIVNSRIPLLNWYRSQRRVSMRACDNVQIDAKAKFKQCSGCHEMFYCSEVCQIVHWKQGGHRSLCTVIGPRRLSYPLTKRGRSFIRALLHDAYKENQVDVLLAQVDFLRHDPFGQYCTFMDFTENPASVKINRIDYRKDGVDLLNRMKESRGRIQVHAFRIRGDDGIFDDIVPLQSSDSRLHDGIHRIARAAPRDVDVEQFRGQIEELIASTKETLTEIH
ncbi:hypothetical protein B0H19DRAFT_1122645 [Mycena capillaripes]|nr:hypothetical protein B0H19DRAFT_1122645 [Mycena capillaripes]